MGLGPCGLPRRRAGRVDRRPRGCGVWIGGGGRGCGGWEWVGGQGGEIGGRVVRNWDYGSWGVGFFVDAGEVSKGKRGGGKVQPPHLYP